MRKHGNLKSLGTLNFLVLIGLFLSFAQHAKSDSSIHAFDSYKQASVLLMTSDLIVVDLDATTFESAQSLGSDDWYRDEVAKQKAAGLQPDEITLKLRPLSEWVAENISHRFVEDGFGQELRRLITSGVRVMALTARRANNVAVTERALRQVGLDFSSTAPAVDVTEINGMPYVKGVFYVGSTDKGVALNLLLDKAGLRPRQTVFFDDLQKNVDNVMKALSEHGLAVQGVIYHAAAVKAAKHPYQPEIAAYQLRELEAGRTPRSDTAVLGLLRRSESAGLRSAGLGLTCSALFAN